VSDEFSEPNEEAQEPGENQAPADSGGQPAPDDMDEALAELLDSEGEQLSGVPEGAQPSELSDLDQLKALVAERTADLQRLHAEYANYKKRVDRDRLLSRSGGIEAVVLDLLPVLDSVESAREHSELVGGFKLVADELEKITAKYGLETYGDVGDPFDPQIHDALMQLPMEGELSGPTVSAVMQRGVKLDGRVIRPARVGVADPDHG
jgi:molecular chaperone GrpE